LDHAHSAAPEPEVAPLPALALRDGIDVMAAAAWCSNRPLYDDSAEWR